METQQQTSLKTKTPMDAKQRQTGNNNTNIQLIYKSKNN
jgi:hypothetical protein